MEKLRVGVIGLGNRGHGLMKEVILQMPMVEVTAVCDAYADRAEEGGRLTQEMCGRLPAVTTDYREVCAGRMWMLLSFPVHGKAISRWRWKP